LQVKSEGKVKSPALAKTKRRLGRGTLMFFLIVMGFFRAEDGVGYGHGLDGGAHGVDSDNVGSGEGCSNGGGEGCGVAGVRSHACSRRSHIC